MNKPDVLSDEQLREWCQSHQERCNYECGTMGTLSCRLQAQRDNTWQKAQDYYEPLAKENENLKTALAEYWVILTERLEEARAEVVREMVEAYDAYIAVISKDIDSLIGLAVSHGWKSSQIVAGEKCRANIESLKSKYLQEEKHGTD
jgi:hypothetical protein